MNNYAESTDKETGRKSYIRTSSRTGEAVTLENISMSGDIARALKFAVSSVTTVLYHFPSLLRVVKSVLLTRELF